MNSLEWYWYRWLAKWLTFSPVPYNRADPWQVYEEMRADGGDHWGRRLVFANWLAGAFGETTGRRIWLQIGESPSNAQKDEEDIMESSV